MQKEQLIMNVGHIVQLRPIARRLAPGGELPRYDDAWKVDCVNDQGVHIRNLATGHETLISHDQIHSYVGNPNRDTEAQKHGFFQLRVQINLLPDGLEMDPLPPGVWGESEHRKDDPSEEPVRFSTLNDPKLSRLMAQIRESGEEPCLPLFKDRDAKLLQAFRIAYYPGTHRQILVGNDHGRCEALLMLKPHGKASK